MELRLKATAGPSSNTEYTKPGVLKLSVGRTRASKIWIKDSAVSEKHAQLWWQGSDWVVQDTDSSNGTSVNGTALTANGMANIKPQYMQSPIVMNTFLNKGCDVLGEPTLLKHGDLIKFGTDSVLEVEVQLVPLASSPKPRVHRLQDACRSTQSWMRMLQSSSILKQRHESKLNVYRYAQLCNHCVDHTGEAGLLSFVQ